MHPNTQTPKHPWMRSSLSALLPPLAQLNLHSLIHSFPIHGFLGAPTNIPTFPISMFLISGSCNSPMFCLLSAPCKCIHPFSSVTASPPPLTSPSFLSFLSWITRSKSWERKSPPPKKRNYPKPGGIFAFYVFPQGRK